MADRKKIGEILVEQGLITTQTIERSVKRSHRLNQKLGRVLEEMEIITDQEVSAALAAQYGFKTVQQIARFRFAPELLALVPQEMALENMIFPLKQQDGKLAIATADPTDRELLAKLTGLLKLSLVPFVATRREIMAAIACHYLGKEPGEKNGTTILIVDDDKLMVAMITNMLKRSNFHSISARDGMEGYRRALAEEPDLILTDKEMPLLNGYGLLNSLRSIPETASIPVILLTGAIDPDEEARAFESGFFDYLSKPVKEVTLITRVRRGLESVGHRFAEKTKEFPQSAPPRK